MINGCLINSDLEFVMISFEKLVLCMWLQIIPKKRTIILNQFFHRNAFRVSTWEWSIEFFLKFLFKNKLKSDWNFWWPKPFYYSCNRIWVWTSRILDSSVEWCGCIKRNKYSELDDRYGGCIVKWIAISSRVGDEILT